MREGNGWRSTGLDGTHMKVELTKILVSRDWAGEVVSASRGLEKENLAIRTGRTEQASAPRWA